MTPVGLTRISPKEPESCPSGVSEFLWGKGQGEVQRQMQCIMIGGFSDISGC